MKKYVILLCLLLSITACGNKVETPESNKKEEEVVEKKKQEDIEEVKYEKEELIEVPDLEALSEEKAKKILKELDSTMNIEIEKTSDGETPEGHVIKTSPVSGRKIKKGSTITLYISDGKNGFIVEDYTGKNYLEVKATLEANGIKVIVETKNTSFATGENLIIEQSVSSGEKLNPGDKITLYIPIKSDTYPDFTKGDYTIEQVKKFCEEYDVILIIQEVPSNEKSGTIIMQSRPVGSKILGNQTLLITIAK